MKILLTGGGSGGHVSPALAVAGILRRNPDNQLLYIGSSMTMEGSTGPSIEEKLVIPTGIPYKSIRAGKLRRDGFSVATLRRLWGVVPGFFEALAVVRKFNPNVVFSSGGYVSLPVVIAAALLRKPIVIHEQTAVVGLANKLASKVATKVAVTFIQSTAFFPAGKVVVTGNPIRPEVLTPSVATNEFTRWLEQADRPIIYVTGGGLGSHIINTTIEELLPGLLEHYCVVHQCGAHAQFQDYERLSKLKQQFDTNLTHRYWPSQYFNPDEVGVIYRHAAMVIARSGANTVLELAAVGVPAIFVPIPWVTHDEQTKNAQVLVEVGMAVIVPEKDLSAPRLLETINQFYAQRAAMIKNRQQAKTLVDLQAADKLTDLIMSVAH